MRISERKCDCSHQMMPIADYPEESTLYYPNWDDSGVLTLVYKLNTDGSITFKDINLSVHMIDEIRYREVYDLPYLEDGWYKVRSYIFPSLKFLYKELGMCNGFNDITYQNNWKTENYKNMFKENHTMTIALNENGKFYYLAQLPKMTPGKMGHCYNWAYGSILDVIDELQKRGVEDEFVYGTNIRVIEEDFFTICHLNKCFINKAKQLLSLYGKCPSSTTRGSKCLNNIDDFQIQIRDYMWMTINAIKYALECEDYQTANKLLSCISTCNGICTDVEEDCGCGQYKPLTTAKRTVYKLPEEAYTTNIQLNFFDKNEVLNLLNQKQNKLTAGIDINIQNDVINNQHTFLSNNDIRSMWNGK